MRIDPDWNSLTRHAARLIDLPLTSLIAADVGRATDLALRVGPIYANFARQRYDRDALNVLVALARMADVENAIKNLFDGEIVNRSENRPALHTALRSGLGQGAVSIAARDQALIAQQRMFEMARTLANSDVTDIVNVGIGGSDLGPRLVVEALRDFHDGRFRIHFLGNADASATSELIARLDPSRTAVVLVSKSFSTQETLLNGAILKAWLNRDDRFFAVTSRTAAAQSFGVHSDRILPMWDWVGGRYSLWSPVGFVIALAIGQDNFLKLLAGAAEMDAHVHASAIENNLAAWHALTTVWNRNALGYDSHAILPYDDRLALLPSYLQQLVMESLGKAARADGKPVSVATSPVLWGGAGTSCQHSFFQAMHQGTDTVPADFIGVVRPAHQHAESQHVLHSHLLAQGEALANGYQDVDAQKAYPGNRPSTMLLLDELTPHSLGALLTLYEHSVYVQAVIWGINPFDQWGVELGKKIASGLLPAVLADDDAKNAVADPITRALLAEIRSRR